MAREVKKLVSDGDRLSILVTAVIPAFNEAARIGETVGEVATFVDEVVVVDDGSTDATAEAAQAAGARVVRQPTNRGYIAAIRRGFAEARGDIVVTLDADGEFPAEAIPLLIAPIARGEADMVQGRRDRVPRLSEKVLTALACLGGPVGDSGTGMRALRADLARQLRLDCPCICGALALEVLTLGGRIAEAPIQVRSVDKPRRIAWHHILQALCVCKWLWRRVWRRGKGR